MRQGGRQQEKLSQIILSFDVNNEKFREQPLPDDGSFSGHSVELIASFKGLLALFQFGRSQQLPYIIWVMQEYGILEPWNKLCVVLAEVYIHFNDFMKYSLLLIQKNYQGKEVQIEPKTLHEKEIGFPIKLSLDIATCWKTLLYLMEQMWCPTKKKIV